MRAGILLIVLYWALFTIRAGLQPKVAAEVKAATYDMKRASGLEKLEHTRRLQCWTVAKWALRVCGWAENVLLGVVILWVAFLLGAVLTGTVIVFGYGSWRSHAEKGNCYHLIQKTDSLFQNLFKESEKQWPKV